MNPVRLLVLAMLAALAAALGGCGAPPGPPIARPTAVIYRPPPPPTTAVLLAAESPTLTPAALEARREDVIAYLREHGYLASNDVLVNDTARADRLVRVVLDVNGRYEVTVFHPGGNHAAATPYGTGRAGPTTVIEREPIYPVFPRTYRPFPRYLDPLYRDPWYRDPFSDPFWPGSAFDFHYRRDYFHPSPLYPRHRPHPPPVVVRPLDPPPPARPRRHEPEDESGITPREPPPAPQPRRDPPADFRNDFPRPPR